MAFDLYSYPESWEEKTFSSTLAKTIKTTYSIKALALLPLLPIDIVILIFRILTNTRFDCFIATEKWPSLTEEVHKTMTTATISPPNRIFSKKGLNKEYIPASIFYIIAAFGLFLPRKLKPAWSNITIKICVAVLKKTSKKDAKIIVHSDALPFARALVIASNEIGMRTICIQHGSFSSSNKINERDGFLCSDNIVRSIEDGEIIKKANPATVLHVTPAFFRLTARRTHSENQKILLIGEGYHIIDKEFNNRYLKKLKELSAELISCGILTTFRPHPSERNRATLFGFENIDTSDINSALNGVDAVIGFSSTLLHEAAEAGVLSFYIDVDNTGHKITGRNGATILKYTNPLQTISIIKKNKNIPEIKKTEAKDLFSIISILKTTPCRSGEFSE